MRLRRLCIVALAAAGLAVSLGHGAPPAPPAATDAILKRFVEELIPLTPGTGIYPASFVMGSGADSPASERPAHKVTLTRPFALAKYEVTQELYQAIMGNNPSRWKGPRNSVAKVSWPEANTFCLKVTDALRQRQLLEAGQVIRLPSETEWEYACRAGTTTRYSFGDAAGDLTQYAWFTGNARGNDPPVGAKRPNPWGLYDMHGYVWEWCADAWHADYQGAPTDGSARPGAASVDRVIRGGAWTEAAENCRSACRQPRSPQTRSDAIGFRCVRAASRDTKKGTADERK
jgi:formylglycine-generating enzyme required for sulfatase activity